MFRTRIGPAVAGFLLLFAGCDSVNEAINDALPEISVADGVLGLGGDAGKEVSVTLPAGKSKAAIEFAFTESFDDLDSGDVESIESLKTSIGFAQNSAGGYLTLRRGSSATLPDRVSIGQASVSWSLSETGGNAPVSHNLPSTLSVDLVRASSCAATATSCTYAPAGGNSGPLVLTNFSLNQAEASRVFDIVKESTPATPNTVSLSVALNVTAPAEQLAGATITVRIGEFETTIQPTIKFY